LLFERLTQSGLNITERKQGLSRKVQELALMSGRNISLWNPRGEKP